MQAPISGKAFRFLELPPEVRLMVYERVFTTRKCHHTIELLDRNYATIVTNTFSVSLLTTCRLIYEESLPLVENLLDTIKRSLPRMILDTRSLWYPKQKPGFLPGIMAEACARLKAINVGVHSDPPFNAVAFQHRLELLKSAGRIPLSVNHLSQKDCSALAHFIEHIAWHQFTCGFDTMGVEIGLRTHRFHSDKPDYSELAFADLWSTREQIYQLYNTPVCPKALILMGDFQNEALYNAAVECVEELWEDSLLPFESGSQEPKIVDEDTFCRDWRAHEHSGAYPCICA